MANLQEKAYKLVGFLKNQTLGRFVTPEGVLFSLTVMGCSILAQFPANKNERGYARNFATSDMEIMREFLYENGYSFTIRDSGVPIVSRAEVCIAS